MKELHSQIKLQTCNLCDAMHRNITDNFVSVSFKIENNGEIKVKIVLKTITTIEEEYIDDLITEFESMQEYNNVKEVIVTEDKEDSVLLENVVYRQDDN